IVQGDTTTTLAGALAAFYREIPVAHVEAGLRTGDMTQPFPEEMNRVLTSRLAAWHFAPTARAAEALLREGTARERGFVTGNTGIDAVLYVRDALDSGALRAPEWPWLEPGKHIVLATSHRRESFGPGFESAMRALARLASRGDVRIVYPVHRNPNVAGPGARHSRRAPPCDAARPFALRAVRGPDAALPADYHRLRRHPRRSALAGQARAGAAREDRTPRSRGSWHGETGGLRRGPHRSGSRPAPGRPRRIRAHDAHPQPLWRRSRLRAHRPSACGGGTGGPLHLWWADSTSGQAEEAALN